jgi:hypothetical protein
MRHVAVGRHARYPYRPSRMSYVIVLLAAIAAIIASLAFASQSESAQAQPAANQAPVIMADRGAEIAVADDSVVQLARAKTVAARLAAARVRAAAIAAALTYAVRPGDSLSSVAQRHCGAARDWTGIYAASRARGWTAHNANSLTAGQHLWLSCSYVPSMLKYAPAPPPPPPVVRTVAVSTGSSGYHSTYHRSYSAPAAAYHGSGSMEQCIISRESGGSSQVMNSSGHYGLYQFSSSTWAGSGGNPADFGHASVSEQRQVFQNAVAARGYSDWTPYDGC